MNMPKIGQRIVVLAWAFREEAQCGRGVAWDPYTMSFPPPDPEHLGLIWVPQILLKPLVCVCVGWERKAEGILHTKVEEQHKRFTHTSSLRFPRVVTKPNGKPRLAYHWREFK